MECSARFISQNLYAKRLGLEIKFMSFYLAGKSKSTVMKPIPKFTIFFILLAIFTSCNKDKDYVYIAPPPPPPPPPAITDTLSGHEFIFDNLTWVAAYEEFMDIDETFVTTPPRPDLFSSFRRKEVSFKFDSSSQWIYPQDNYYYSPGGYYYWYYTTSSSVRILSNNLLPDLAGRKATVRVKFL